MGALKDYLRKCSIEDAVDIFNEYIGYDQEIPPSKLVCLNNAPADDPHNGLNAYCTTYYIKPMQLFEALEMTHEQGIDPMEKFVLAEYAFFKFESPTTGSLSFPDNDDIRSMVQDIANEIEKFFAPKIKSGEVAKDAPIAKIFAKMRKADEHQR